MSDESAETLTWTVRLSGNSRIRLLGVAAGALAAGLVGCLITGQVLTGLLAFAIILASTAEYWLGVSFKLTPVEASRRIGPSISAIRWEDVKRIKVTGSDIKLSPLASETKLDPFRGITIRTTQENRERVQIFVEAHTKANV